MKDIISFQMMGGLGNILFSFATSFALSKKYNLDLKLTYSHTGYVHTLPPQYKENLFKNFKESDKGVSYDRTYDYLDLTYKDIILEGAGNVFLNGYFQSEKYFVEARQEIIDHLLNDEVLVKKIKEKHFKSTGSNVSLHVRRGNYTSLQNHHPLLTTEYYKKALNEFTDSIIFVFSDDIDFCKTQFIGEKFKFVENEHDYEDLYLMSLCDHHIIANSTFSWWGAWLNTNTNKQVIAPSNWFGPAYGNNFLTDIIPESWMLI